MRILILTQFFHPEPGPRVHELAAELAGRGHQVSVITGFPTVPFATFYDGYRPSVYRLERYGEAQVVRVPHFPHGRKSALRRLLHYGSFAVSAASLGNMLVGRSDCMYVFLPPPLLGFAAHVISRTRGIPYMYDIQDIWPEAIEGSGITLPGGLMRALKRLAHTAHRLPDAISVPSPGYKRHLEASGIDPGKIEVIPNWADESCYRPIDYDADFAREFGLDGKFNVVFAGNLGWAQALETVLDCAPLVAHIPDIQFVLAGEGLASKQLQEKACKMGLHNVRFLGRMNQDRMPSLFSVSDLLLVHLRKSPIFTITIPGKTQAYMASGKPILMAVEGDGAELIETAGAGLTCPQEDPAALARCVKRFYDMSPAERSVMGQHARRAYLERFTRKTVVSQFESLLRRVARMDIAHDE
ncbi:MAG: glycosyltransferase family 4 protein [Thermodesulfobacteriota bacterium]